MTNHGRTYLDPSEVSASVVTKPAISYLTDEVYGQVVRAMPIPCADAVFILEDEGVVEKALWLAKRSVFPHRDWWVIGGRLKFDDGSLEEAVSRNVLRETGVSIDPSRFKCLTTAYYAWSRTKQHEDQPGKNLAVTFVCVVSRDEMTAISRGLTSEEYQSGVGLHRFTRAMLVNSDRHKALIDIYDLAFPSFAQRVKNAVRALFGRAW